MGLAGAPQLFLVTEELLRQFAVEVSRAMLAEIGSLLPPYSKYALPPNTRKAEFCAAIASGAVRSQVRGRVHYVARNDWDAYVTNGSGSTQDELMEEGVNAAGEGEPITVLAHSVPANDPPEETAAPVEPRRPGKPTARELLEQARSQMAARQKVKGR